MLPIWLYGSHTCEDTAITRDRLSALGIRFIERDKEDDASVAALLEKHNAGMQRTPTLVIGDDEIIIAEPTMEQLEDSLIQAGYIFDAPGLRRFDSKQYLPEYSALAAIPPAASGVKASQALYFFAHTEACRVCQGYAKQIATQNNQLAQQNIRLQIVLHANLDQAKKWAKEFAANAVVLIDGDGEFKRQAANRFPDTWDIRTGGVWLMLVDAQDDTIRAGAYAADAGGLVAPGEIVRWVAAQK